MALARSLVRGGLSAGLVVCSVVGAERAAHANGFEIPENGTEVMGRAGAWTAKADNALAGALNPAGLAGIPSGMVVNANITYQSMCFQKAGNYPTSSANGGTKWESSTYEGKPYPEVCKSNEFKDLNVVPQLAFNYAVNSKLGVAFLPLWTPSGAGKASWPTEVPMPDGTTAPSPSRFLIVSKAARIIMPTLAAGYEVSKGLRFGAGFQWVITMFSSTLISQGTQSSEESITQGPKVNTGSDVKFNQWFTPAAVFGAMYSPTDDVDVGAMFRYSADVVYKGRACDQKNTALATKPDCDVVITAPYYGKGTSASNTPTYTGAEIKEFRLPQPMDIRLGFRWHPARKGVELPKEGRRDFLKHDAFDVEVDLNYARNSTFDQITVLFAPGQNVFFSGGNGGYVPENASITKAWKDTLGVRIGGDVNILPERLSARAGAFFQTSAQDAKYLNLDFHPGQMLGLYLGATARVARNVDVSLGYGHIFVKDFDNNGNGALRALVATPPDQPNGPNYYNVCNSDFAKSNGYTQPNEAYRSCAISNSGRLSSAFNMFSVGATIKF
jgi:long-subunit fatty acid transport protein